MCCWAEVAQWAANEETHAIVDKFPWDRESFQEVPMPLPNSTQTNLWVWAGAQAECLGPGVPQKDGEPPSAWSIRGHVSLPYSWRFRIFCVCDVLTQRVPSNSFRWSCWWNHWFHSIIIACKLNIALSSAWQSWKPPEALDHYQVHGQEKMGSMCVISLSVLGWGRFWECVTGRGFNFLWSNLKRHEITLCWIKGLWGSKIWILLPHRFSKYIRRLYGSFKR